MTKRVFSHNIYKKNIKKNDKRYCKHVQRGFAQEGSLYIFRIGGNGEGFPRQEPILRAQTQAGL